MSFQADLLKLADASAKCGEQGHGVLVISNLMRQAIPINIQPVADYLYQGTEKEDWYLDEDFPNLAPPWELSWFHWNPPSWVRSEGAIINSPMMKDYEYGCLLVGLSMEYFVPDGDKHLLAPEGAKWFNCFYLHGRNKRTGQVSWYSFKFFVDAQGVGLFQKGGLHASEAYDWPTGACKHLPHGAGPFSPRSKHHGQEHPPLDNDVIGTLFPVFLAISFCHCRNVEVRDIPIPTKVQKKRDSKGVWSPKIRREIHIEPMRKILKDTPGTHSSDIKRQLAIRRGHFKDFKEGRGLFGKHHGLYWWDNWVRTTTGVKYQVEAKGAGR